MGDRLHGLDALRGVAALVVVFYHIDTLGPWHNGNLAVEFFFLLSGYVMARTYEGRFSTTACFMRKRYKRLIAPFALGCVLGAFALSAAPGAIAGSFVLALLFLPSPFIGPDIFGINRPGWSLFFELTANLFHVLLFRHIRTPALLVLCAALTCSYALDILNHGTYAGIYIERFPAALIRTLAPYTLGIILCRCFDGRELRIPPVFAFIALPLIIFFADSNITKIAVVLVAFPTCLLIAKSEIPSRLIPSASYLGAMSYPLYVLHWPLMNLTTPYAGALLAILMASAWAFFGRSYAAITPNRRPSNLYEMQ